MTGTRFMASPKDGALLGLPTVVQMHTAGSGLKRLIIRGKYGISYE
jgi:hypothetical protein